MVTLEALLIGIALLLIASIVASKLSVCFGVPALVLFVLIGMAIGSEGFGGIAFDNPDLTQSIGIVALVFILYSGGLDTRWNSVRAAYREGLLLSTFSVAITALSVGWLATTFLGFTWATGILLGASMASTDAAAVFSILRGKGVHLKGRLQSILELESGSNDPMAIFLTIGMIQLITEPTARVIDLVPLFFVQMSIGALVGVAMGYLMRYSVNQARLEYDGLYPVLTVALVMLCYGLASVLGGNGFLAIYLSGVLLARRNFIHRNSLVSFHDGLAWLMQIVMFIILGLQVFPSRLMDIAGTGLVVALFLILIARPLGVFMALFFSGMDIRKQIFIAWVGLRGATPIILATFIQISGVEMPVPIFDLVFFVVLVSVLLQGTTIVPVANLLNLKAAQRRTSSIMTRIVQGSHFNDYLFELEIPPTAHTIDKRLIDLTLPSGTLVVLINRESEIVIPQGRTRIKAGDEVLLLTTQTDQDAVSQYLTTSIDPDQPPSEIESDQS